MDDLISRLTAIDALEKEKPTPFVNKDGSIDPFGAGRQNQWYRDGIAIMNLPSAQPERKGKWVLKKDATGNRYGKCSECGMTQYAGQLNYCPNCGADMR